jgi:hypothetical protein
MSNELNYKIFANITGFQMFDPNNIRVEFYYSGFNRNRKSKGMTSFSHKAVKIII